MKTKYLLAASVLAFSLNGFSQSFDNAKKLYSDGEYDKALTAFQKLVKANPGSAAYNYWYGLTFDRLGNYANAEKYLKVSAKKRYVEAYRALGEVYAKTYDFEDAMEQYGLYVQQLCKSKKNELADTYQAVADRMDRAASAMYGVDKINVIDSVVVDKDDFIENFVLTNEVSSIKSYNEFFDEEGDNDGVVCMTPLGGNIVYSDKVNEEGRTALFKMFYDGTNYSNREILPESINAGEHQNYPFIMSDGVTLYYASDSEEGLGGYDIYVTAYNTNTYSYMQPQRLGMPFNSIYNDYMYVIDDYAGLGWFASDRFQPEDKVCIYVFVPSSEKVIYDAENTDPVLLRKAASLLGFHDAQFDGQEVSKGLESLKKVLMEQGESKKRGDFRFVINDNKVYTSIYDFMSKEAQEMFLQWQKGCDELEKLETQLDKARMEYHKANAEKRKQMTNAILDMETRVDAKKSELKAAELKIREKELSKRL